MAKKGRGQTLWAADMVEGKTTRAERETFFPGPAKPLGLYVLAARITKGCPVSSERHGLEVSHAPGL